MYLAKPYLVLPVLGSRSVAEAVLGAVRFVGDHHHVIALAQYRHRGQARLGRKLVDVGEEHSASLHLRQHPAQILATVGLGGRCAQRPGAIGECFVELAIQVVAVGNQHHRGIAEFLPIAQCHHIEQGQQRLARVPG